MRNSGQRTPRTILHRALRLRPARVRSRQLVWAGVLAAALGVLAVAAMLSAQSWQAHQRVLQAARHDTGGDPARGPAALRRYSCGGCHEIAGVDDARGLVGPPLSNFGARRFVAGELLNTPDNLVRWIMHPHAVEPHTAMPEMGVSEEDARDMAAYLYTLR